MAKIQLFVLCFLSCYVVNSPLANATQTWKCKISNYGTSTDYRYVLRDGYLFEYGPGYAYRIIIDNDLAVVAVGGAAIEQAKSAESFALIGANTVAINKHTGELVEGGTWLYRTKSAPVERHGTCQPSSAS